MKLPKIALKVSPKLISAVFPKKHSKILAGIKHKEEIGARRAQKFMNTCQQIAELREQRKHGSIADKDLSKYRFERR